MKIWVGLTDNKWFEFLVERQPDEVNFWQPRGTYAFRAIDPGELFLFKLHSPYDFIVGGGLFVRHSFLPLSMAWGAFGTKNEALDYETLLMQVSKYREDEGNIESNPMIGCIILNAPFFLQRSEWIPVPADWKPGIQRGKTYDTDDNTGLTLWGQIQERLPRMSLLQEVAEEPAAYGEYIVRARLGQGTFRVLVTDAYERRCAITTERTLPVLEAVHIKPFAKSGPNKVHNGLLLRSDFHILFDQGYVTVTKDFRTEMSKRIKEEFDNGEEYWKLRGKRIFVPLRDVDRPSPQFIEWHNDKVYIN